MIVVDTNVIAYLVLEDPLSSRAEALFRKDSFWASPQVWRSEFRNVLAGKLRRKELDLDRAIALQVHAEGVLAGAEFPVASTVVLDLVASSNCSAYDCEFVALAGALNCPLYTMDSALLRAFPRIARQLPRS